MSIPEKLIAKNDGRKKAWWVKKIEMLEEEIAQLKTGSVNGEANGIYADGFVDCMHRFQILNKAARQNLHRQISIHGKGTVKHLKAAKFRGVTL